MHRHLVIARAGGPSATDRAAQVEIRLDTPPSATDMQNIRELAEKMYPNSTRAAVVTLPFYENLDNPAAQEVTRLVSAVTQQLRELGPIETEQDVEALEQRLQDENPQDGTPSLADTISAIALAGVTDVAKRVQEAIERYRP